MLRIDEAAESPEALEAQINAQYPTPDPNATYPGGLAEFESKMADAWARRAGVWKAYFGMLAREAMPAYYREKDRQAELEAERDAEMADGPPAGYAKPALWMVPDVTDYV